MKKELGPIEIADRLTSRSKLDFGWSGEEYCQAHELLTSSDSRRKLRSKRVVKKVGKNRKRKAPLSRHLLAAARIHQILYGEKTERAGGVSRQEIIKREEGEHSPQSIHLISFTGYPAQFKDLQAFQTPWFNFKSVTSMVELGEIFDKTRALLRKTPSEQIVILVGRPELSPRIASFLIASFKTIQGEFPEEIAFMGIAQNKQQLRWVRKWLLQQLTSGDEDYSDRLIGAISRGGSNKRFCQNIVSGLIQAEFIKRSLGT
jgi:hypothetical protein